MKHAVLFVLPLLALSAGAAELRVSTGGPHADLKSAIAAARSGDVIVVDDGMVLEPGVIVGKAVTIRGASGDWRKGPSLHAKGRKPCIEMRHAGAKLIGFRLSGTVGGGNLENCLVSDGSAEWYAGGSATNCVFTGNRGTSTALCSTDRPVSLVGCTFTNNTSSSVIAAAGRKPARLELRDCRIADNVCWSSVVWANARDCPDVRIAATDCEISGNNSKWGSTVSGAGTYRRCRITGNLVGNKHAAVTAGTNDVTGPLLLDGCIVSGNRTGGKCGGGTKGFVVAVGSDIRGNRSGSLDAVDTLFAATNCALAIGTLVGGDVRGGVGCTRGETPRKPWRLNADGSFPLVRGGQLVSRIVAEEGPAQALAEREYRRLMKKITDCDADAAAYAAAEGVIELRVDPAIGEGDTYEVRRETVDGRERLVLCGSNGRSTWFALMEVMERIGCRWFWPGDDGEYLPPKTGDLGVPRFTVKRTAAFPMRSLSLHPDLRKEMFLAHNRFNPFLKKVDWGQVNSLGGHSFWGIVPDDCKSMREFRDKHPEMMALAKNGKRRPDQHCYTNPKTVRLFVDWICKFWEEHPDCELLGLSPVDTPVYCTCEECAKHGDSSTLYFDFLTTIVNEANKRCPGRKYRSFAYSFYWKVPQNPLPPNVMLDYCMYDRCYMHALNDPSCEKNRTPVRKMTDWKAHLGGVAPAVYGYHFDWGGEPFFVPQNRVLQDEIKWARDLGVKYWHTEWMCGWQQTKSVHEKAPRETERIYAYRLSAYCLGRLLWDPDADLERIEGDWCKRVYGTAGREMQAYFTAMESAWMRGKGHPSWYGIKPYNFCDGFLTPELIAECDGYFAAGEKKLAATDDERAKGELALEKAFWLKWRAAVEKKKPAASKKPKKVRLDGTGKPLQD